MGKLIRISTMLLLAAAIIALAVGLYTFDVRKTFIAIPLIFLDMIISVNYFNTYSLEVNFRSLTGVVCILGSTLFVVGFVMLLFCNGGPKEIDGQYYVVNHGQIIRSISYKYFRALQLCEVSGLGGMGVAVTAAYCNYVSKRLKEIRR